MSTVSEKSPMYPHVMTTAERFNKLFGGRGDVHGASVITDEVDERGKRKANSRLMHEPVTIDLWNSHLSGQQGLGILPLCKGSTCKFGAIDVDEYEFDYLTLIRAASERQRHLIPCRSKSGGIHLYMFAAVQVSAQSMRQALTEARSNLGLPEKTEIFPKSDQFEPGECAGGWINMPYFGGSRPAIRADGTEMTAEEFLDHAERLCWAPAESERKAYQRGPAAGNR
jgi:hypothetical protein